MEYVVHSSEATIALGERLGKALVGGETILLSGDLGAGKTTFTKGIARGLTVSDIITSPTFTILNEYDGRIKLFHFDMYRLDKNGDEELGFEEYYNRKDSVCVIEWNVSDYPFDKVIKVDLKYISEDSRSITIDEIISH